jgi:hypothetical protein
VRPLAASALLFALSAALEPSIPSVTFTDATGSAGLDVVIHNSPTPARHQIETMAGGVAAFDYDDDGLLDLFFTNGAQQPALVKPDPTWWNRLYRNRGNGVFEDVTARAGLRGEGFSTAAAAADYDNDGHPDLFVVNYVKWDPAAEPVCKDPTSSQIAHCHPKFYTGLPNTLYHNNGDGTFTDVTAASVIGAHIGKGMCVAFADCGGDGPPRPVPHRRGQRNLPLLPQSRQGTLCRPHLSLTHRDGPPDGPPAFTISITTDREHPTS